MNYSVYIHICPNKKVYIGITARDVLKRWNNGKGYKNNKHFYSAIQKYGWENIEHKVLYENLAKEEACKKEMELIQKYNSNKRECGYNKSSGGENPCNGVKPWNKGTHITNSGSFKKGHKVSDEIIQKVIEAHKGKSLSEETKKKMSDAHKKEKAYWYGKELPEYVKNKIREKHNKKIICIETNEVFMSIKEAKEKTGLNHIGDCCNKKQKQCGGLHFEFYDNKEELWQS